MTTMPFGKYRGWPLNELPDDYINWLAALGDLRQPLRGAVENEWWRRACASAPRAEIVPALRIEPHQVALARQVFELGYRATAMKLHPDAGGSTEQMQRLNGLADTVRKQLRAMESR
jgi:hypothetical protein